MPTQTRRDGTSMFSITSHLWLWGVLELRKVGLRLACYIALNSLLHGSPVAFQMQSLRCFFSLKWAVAYARAQPRAQLCTGLAPFVSFEPAAC